MTSSETSSRNCGECTVCCSGWLRAEIHGHHMGGGVACHFLKREGCGIYESRPQVCRDFVCGWLMPGSPFPDHWRPDKIGVIIRADRWQDKRCWLLVHAGQDPGEDVLEKMRQHTIATGEPHVIKKSNSWLCFGKPEFQQAMVRVAQEAVGEVEFKTTFLPS